MKNKWRKLMAVFCAASMLMSLPGVSVYAAELTREDVTEDFGATPDEVDKNEDILEDVIFEEPDIAQEAMEPTISDAAPAEMTEGPAEVPDPAKVEELYPEEQEDAEMTAEQSEENGVSLNDLPIEELVGATSYTVGDGVLATFDPDTGSIELMTANGGTLWSDWLERAGIDRSSVKSINVVTRLSQIRLKKVKLPADSCGLRDAQYYVFGGLRNLTSLDIAGFDTSNVTNMSYLFYCCEKLTSLDLSGLNTSKVTNMSVMFCGCEGLTTLNMSGLDTSKVTDMNNMFFDCYKLANLNITGLNLSNVTDLSYMFWCCYALKTLDLSNFNLSKAMNISSMFANCTGLTTLNLSGINTSSVTNISGIFYRCESLKNLDMSGLNTSKVTDMDSVFTLCKSLTKLDLSGFTTSNVTSMAVMFKGCENLTTLDLSKFDTSNVTSMYAMFEGCKKLQKLDLRTFKSTKLQFMHNMFKDCVNLKYIDIGNFNASQITLAEDTFKGCKALDILITPSNKKSSPSCYLPHTMYDRNGKAYSQLPVNETAKVLGRTKELAATIFIDVRDPSHAYYNAIYWAVEKGITKGYSDGTFGIDRSCTRGEMMMFLWRYAGKPEPKTVSQSPFKDVPKTHTFYKAILWGSQKGITKGYSDGTFGVNRNVSRGESMMFLWRLRGKQEPTPVSVSPFKDVPKTHVFYKAILWGYQKGVTTGYKTGPKAGTFGVDENCTRGQIVTFLYRARNL